MKAPLSDLLRPLRFDDFVGQRHLTDADGWITQVVASGKPLSVLFWGPPGCGKTTLAKLYMHAFPGKVVFFHPALHGIADLKKLVAETESSPLFHQNLMVFVDEIHRFSKAQQDAFLPYVENGTFVLVGATTENPSFSLNGALLSRMRVLSFEPLDKSALKQILQRAQIKQPIGSPLTDNAEEFLLDCAGGDARYLLNMLESLLTYKKKEPLQIEDLQKLLTKKVAYHDKKQDSHYNLISALHKSIRGSDPDAALYWISRMLAGGEDPGFLARRLVRMASEDIGLSDPQALSVALDAWQSYERVGSPEGDLFLAQAAVYLALAPKSNALYTAYNEARKEAEETSSLPPPATILNAPNTFLKEMGYGKGYLYDHDLPHAFSGQEYFPNQLKRRDYYKPKERGFEREMKKRKEYFAKLRKDLQSKS